MEYKGPNDLLIHVCEQMMTVALISLLVLMVPALAALFTLKEISVSADLVMPLVVRPVDLLFIVGQLLILLTLWTYFRCFVPFVEERPGDHLLSLALALVLSLNNYFSLLDAMLPLRGAFVTVVLLLTWIKDIRFRARFPKSKTVRSWYNRVFFTMSTAALASIGFAFLMSQGIRHRAFLIFDRWYDLGLQLSFYVAFVIITLRSFRTNYNFFQDEWKGEPSVQLLKSGQL
jgi:hypothetical protein